MTVTTSDKSHKLTSSSRGLLGSNYARDKQALMALINEIRSTGASLDVDLPTIVVAGNQSSGKSSLIEAISGIMLPRAAGTCTRVPIEVRLRQESNKVWSCAVKIRREVDELGEVNSEGSKPEVDFGPVIYDDELVESTIRRAQLAILNPTIPSDQFVTYDLPGDEEDDHPLGSPKQLSFSRNVVVLEISGPYVTDLTLVDLPGIIQNVSKGEDKKNIKLVEDLVTSYIKRECLILLVITMKDDIQNQKAALLASEVDPEGKRTIGVLTKVDTLQGRDKDQWLKVLHNTDPKTMLLHGYYVTRQPNADELADGITFDTARLNETTFFTSHAPWNTLSPVLKERLGTKNLTASLSDKLSSFIQGKLPSLQASIHSRYDAIGIELDQLGKEPSNDPVSEMNGLVTSFIDLLEANCLGRDDYKDLMQAVNLSYDRYKHQVWAKAPRFVPFTLEEIKKHKEPSSTVTVDYMRKIPELDEGSMGAGGVEGQTMNLNDIKDHIKRSITRELPNNTPFECKVQLIRHFTSTWPELSRLLLSDIQPSLELLLDNAIQETFGRYQEGMLAYAVSEIIKEQLRILANNTQTQIAKMVALEDRPFTMNDHFLNEVRGKILAHLKETRYPSTQVYRADRQDRLNVVLGNLNYCGFEGVKETDLARLRPTDEYEAELDVMAEVRAYWQVAYKRIIDNVPRVVDAEFIIPAAHYIRNALLKDLSVFAKDGEVQCRKYLAESPLQMAQRDDLNKRRERLGKAKYAIMRFGTAK